MEQSLIKSTNRSKLMHMRVFVLAYMKWEANKKASFARLFREELKLAGLYKTSSDIRKLIKDVEICFQTSLEIQSFVCFKELIKDANFDLALKKGDYDFKKIKTQIDINGVEKTTNSKQLISIIRNAFAHNDDNLTPNWHLEGTKICITSVKDKAGTRRNIKISLTNMIQLLQLYLDNIDWSDYDTKEIKTSELKLKRAIKEKTLTVAQVGNIFKPMGLKSGKQEMDKFQKKAMFNCLTKTDFFTYEECKHIDSDFLAMLYPFKENAFQNCGDIMDVISCISQLPDNYTSHAKFINETAKNYVLSFGDKKFPMRAQHQILFTVGDNGKIPSVLINNLLFNIFTFESEENLQKCFREDLNIRKLRNSLMHGRHFYNYNNGYEFYDGINEMEHVATITCEEVLQATNILLNNYLKEKSGLNDGV